MDLKKKTKALPVILLLALVPCFLYRPAQAQKIAGPLLIEEEVYPGYTLFAPLNSKNTYLIDNCGRVINKWQSQDFPGNTAYLMPDGNLLRTRRLNNAVINGGGGGGGVEILDWSSKLIWSFELNTDLLRLHHDVTYLPNGNVLLLAWELHTESEVLAAGRDPMLMPSSGVIWSEQVLEVKPGPTNSFDVIWKWSLWDHLVQDRDIGKPAYGVVSDHPERVDINYSPQNIADWIHANAIDYNPTLDQIVISSPFFNEFWIIDHSTSIAEAASHEGGNSGKGGDLLYRWGNPAAYQRGTISDQKLFGQHDVHWIKEGEHAGKIILFNNNKGDNFSSIEIIDPPLNAQSTYDIDTAFGPSEPDIVFTENPPEMLFSQIMAGAELLPNGNLLICSSRQGIFYEVNPSGEKVWFYKSPVTVAGIIGRDIMETDPNFNNDLNFRTIKYGYDYPAFDDRHLIPGEPIEGKPWATCELVTALHGESAELPEVFPNPVQDVLVVRAARKQGFVSASITDLQGRILAARDGFGELTIDMSGAVNGIYILSVNGLRSKILKSER